MHAVSCVSELLLGFSGAEVWTGCIRSQKKDTVGEPELRRLLGEYEKMYGQAERAKVVTFAPHKLRARLVFAAHTAENI